MLRAHHLAVWREEFQIITADNDGWKHSEGLKILPAMTAKDPETGLKRAWAAATVKRNEIPSKTPVRTSDVSGRSFAWPPTPANKRQKSILWFKWHRHHSPNWLSYASRPPLCRYIRKFYWVFSEYPVKMVDGKLPEVDNSIAKDVSETAKENKIVVTQKVLSWLCSCPGWLKTAGVMKNIDFKCLQV